MKNTCYFLLFLITCLFTLSSCNPTHTTATNLDPTLAPVNRAKPIPSPTIKNKAKSPPPSSPAGTIIDTTLIGEQEMNSYFYTSKITDEIYQRIYGKSYKEDCNLPLEQLTYLKVLHMGFDKKTHIGELIVNTTIADTVLTIFKELYASKYPIEKVLLVDEYNADDDASMTDNNSSAFNYRVIDGTTRLSKHSLGTAIDINPLYNPYVRNRNDERAILPKEGAAYADRTLDCPYMISTRDICYKTFIKYGFTWGGNWSSSKDYQHFEITSP